MKKRILSSLLFAPGIVLAVAFGPPWAFEALILSASVLALREGGKLLWGKTTFTAIALGVLPPIGALWGERGLTLATVCSLPLSFLFSLREGPTKARAEAFVGLCFLILYIGWPMAFFVLSKQMPQGLYWIFALVLGVWCGDTAALFVGLWIGKRPLCPSLSPKKTVEGAVAHFMGVAFGVLTVRVFFLSGASALKVLSFVLAIGILSQIGDLSESLLKRSAGVKDSGGLIPGHGGVLDRIDSFVFTSPFLYYLLKLS